MIKQNQSSPVLIITEITSMMNIHFVCVIYDNNIIMLIHLCRQLACHLVSSLPTEIPTSVASRGG